MKVIAHTPVGEFEVDFGDDFTREQLKEFVQKGTNGTYTNMTLRGLNNKLVILGKDTVSNSVFEIVD
jgi:hypothetical protein